MNIKAIVSIGVILLGQFAWAVWWTATANERLTNHLGAGGHQDLSDRVVALESSTALTQYKLDAIQKELQSLRKLLERRE